MILSHITRRKILSLVLGVPATVLAAKKSTAWDELKAWEAPVKTNIPNIHEFELCMNDPGYFIEHYVEYATINGVQKLPILSWQNSVIQNWKTKRGVIGVLPRQSGKTALQVGMILHSLMFGNSATSIMLIAPKHAAAVDIMQQIQFAYDRLPDWLKQKSVVRSKTSAKFGNGSRLMVSSMLSNSCRGQAFSEVYIDEAAFVENQIFEEFWVCVYPTISSGTNTRLMMLSTPNSKNHFHATYMRLSQRKDWYAFQINEHPFEKPAV